MKTLSLGIIFVCLTTWTHADNRPTIDSLIGKKFFIEDSFAGQSFTLLKKKKDYTVSWVRHGSAVPAIRSQKCKVRIDSNYQFRFSLDHPDEKNHEFMVSISGKDEIKVYLNGVRIYVDGMLDKKRFPKDKKIQSLKD